MIPTNTTKDGDLPHLGLVHHFGVGDLLDVTHHIGVTNPPLLVVAHPFGVDQKKNVASFMQAPSAARLTRRLVVARH